LPDTTRLPGIVADLFIETMEIEMNRKFVALTLTAVFASSLFGTVSANPLPRTEIRDPVRGVSFNSIEISDRSVNSLNVIEGTFGDSDSLVVGMSALSFDESEGVDEYILWLRHEGRSWLQFDVDQPVSFEVDGQEMPLEQLRSSQPFVGAASRMFEKIEFRIEAEDIDQLLLGNEFSITLSSNSGIVEKILDSEEIERIRAFRASVENQGLDERRG
jgi:hypothetical protein